MSKRFTVLGLMGAALLLSACASTSAPNTRQQTQRVHAGQTGLSLTDKVQFVQNDTRWARQTLGGSAETLRTDGCLVTAAAMALVNLGFQTDPGDLTNRLKAYDGFTAQGWLVWSGLERATGGVAKTVFTDRTDDNMVRSCMADGYYPLVKFKLPSRRSHWAVVIGEGKGGFYVRDPLLATHTPLPLSQRANGIDAVRCVGVPS